jgi:hypothetical protein
MWNPTERDGPPKQSVSLSQISRLRPGEFGAEVFLPPVKRPRGHISVGVELKDAVPGKDGPEQAGDDEAIGGNSDRAVAVLHDREAAPHVDLEVADRLSQPPSTICHQPT